MMAHPWGVSDYLNDGHTRRLLGGGGSKHNARLPAAVEGWPHRVQPLEEDGRLLPLAGPRDHLGGHRPACGREATWPAGSKPPTGLSVKDPLPKRPPGAGC